MFSRSRRRIIVSIMGSLVLLFVITQTVILFASYREMHQQNSDMLERYVELYFLEQQAGNSNDPGAVPDGQQPGGPNDPGSVANGQRPGDPNDPGTAPDGQQPGGSDAPGSAPRQDEPPLEGRPDYQLSTFYSVAFGQDDTVLAVDNGEKNIYTEEDLIGIAREILTKKQSSGKTDNLTYIVSRRPEYTLVAFMDNTVADNGMQMLSRNVLMIGSAAIIVLFFISLLLSRQIIRPLEDNDRQQKQFISDASHELKTPVSVIGVNAEMLSREIGENAWLANILYENQRMGELVRQLLDLSRAESTETPMEEIDFSRIVEGELLAFESLAFDQGRAILSEIEDGVLLSGNQTQLTQLVSILLDNAIRHATGNRIELSMKRQRHHAVLSVVNDGDEIPSDKLEHLFDRFYRLDEARSGEEQHYGLGLSIAKTVAEKHSGSIGVSCDEGKVRFTVSIPIKR